MKTIPVDPNHPIVRHLWPLSPDAAPDERVLAAIAAYNEATGQRLKLPLSGVEAREVGTWLRKAQLDTPVNQLGHTVALLHRPRKLFAPVVYDSMAAKVGWLSQAPCITCLLDPDASPLGIHFSVQASPFSAQSLPPDKLRCLKQAITADLQRHSQPYFSEPTFNAGQFCVNIVSVVPSNTRVKDVDNMAKGLLDAMEGVIFRNDRQVQHFANRRVDHDGQLGYYSIFVMPVIDARADIVDKELRIAFLSGAPINIEG